MARAGRPRHNFTQSLSPIIHVVAPSRSLLNRCGRPPERLHFSMDYLVFVWYIFVVGMGVLALLGPVMVDRGMRHEGGSK